MKNSLLSSGTSSVKPNLEQTCFDTERLHVRQTKFSPEIEFELRTFRFAIGTDPEQQQQQEFSCLLHIEDQSNANTDQATSCSCYTEAGFRIVICTKIVRIKSLNPKLRKVAQNHQNRQCLF